MNVISNKFIIDRTVFVFVFVIVFVRGRWTLDGGRPGEISGKFISLMNNELFFWWW